MPPAKPLARASRGTSLAAARAASPLPYPEPPARRLALVPPPPGTPPAASPAPPPAAAPAASPPAAAPAPAAPAAPAAPPAPTAAALAVPVPPPAPPVRRAPALPPLPPNAAVPAIHTSVADLLRLARHGLAEATAATAPAERYATAHLSALRGAAAVIAARATPSPTPGRRTRPVSAWVLLAAIAPELAEWAAFFAAGATKRAHAEAGLPGAVTAREADDLLRDAETFLAVVETKLGGAARPSLLDRGVG